ncbi:MAG: peptidoglycan DD-metalloendopeptidase family protein [Longimicrobiales bacterium]|nr:peptidoglycan DD-metalloendopeptidase family protein [Longimicrobiales bacterium]
MTGRSAAAPSGPGPGAPRLATVLGAALLAFLLASAAAPVSAQDTLTVRIRDSQRRLEEIREERRRLQREMEGTRSRVQSVSAELRNIERQLSASRSILAELELQAEATTHRVASSSRELVETRDRLAEGRAVVNRRLRDIYKLGPMSSVRLLLGARSFTDLLNRYRYLRLMASYDRGLVIAVQELETALALQNRELQRSLQELGNLRQGKLTEVAELRSVEQDRQATLARFRTEERRTLSRLETLEADIGRLSTLVDELEERRREEEARRAAGPARLGAGDAGRLEWPVQGELVYRFGRERRPNGTVLRWNGVGIRADAGAPVRAVRAGTVVLAGPFEGYGPTVILSHGDGFYTLYLYLEELGVLEGRRVEEGQVVGTVGGRGSPEGPHVEFQIRAPGDSGAPEAQDPLLWLRPRGSGGSDAP